ncbi:MAG: sulfate adenylyltransferase subunit CysN [Spirochaetales bacterium]|nr:sulfate adenylyltransferase subunit CysN [Spirochaetales bacterium]
MKHEEPTSIVKERDLLRFTTAGSVDDGKSTLIGRMLYDSKQIFQDQMEQLEHSSKLRGEESVNLALLTDGLRSEREQGITIDVAYRYFTTPRRKFIIADTPGHEQYTRNMVTGASTADLAIILIDARNGVVTQSKRHGIIASLLGIPHMVVAVNKLDLVDYSRERFEEIKAEYQDFARKLSINDIEFIPVSALNGDNVVERSAKTPWYEGAPLLQYLETVTIAGDRNLVDFRFPVQHVVRPHQDFRGFSGRIASGTVSIGEEIIVLPSRRKSRVKGIHFYKDELKEAFAGQSVILTLEDEIDISRGDMIVRSHNIPEVSTEFDATLTWMDDQHELDINTQYVLQHTARITRAYVDDLVYRIDVNTLHRSDAETLSLNEIGRVKITAANPIFFDSYDRNRNTGGFVLIDPHDFRTVAAGMIRHASAGTMEELRKEQRQRRIAEMQPTKPASSNIFWDPGYVGLEDRIRRNGHRPTVVWFTGISGSGKSTIAKELEKRLFDAGINAVRLDGDNVRHGLNADLAFSREDRRENVRRIGHLARQLYDFGHIVLCTFVSPYEEDRAAVRSLIPEGDFIEVFVKVNLDEARRRDPKGLYKKVDSGELSGFTGVDAPYEEPTGADVVIDTGRLSVAEAVQPLFNRLAEDMSDA